MYGILPQLFRNLIRDSENPSNAGGVTLTVAETTICTSKSFTCAVGERFLIIARARGQKLVAAGGVSLFLRLDGASTATVTLGGNDITVKDVIWGEGSMAINEWFKDIQVLLLTVTVAGTATFIYRGKVGAQTLSISATDGFMEILQLH